VKIPLLIHGNAGCASFRIDSNTSGDKKIPIETTRSNYAKDKGESRKAWGIPEKKLTNQICPNKKQ